MNTLEEIRQTLKTKDVLKSLSDLQAKNAELQKQIEGFNKEKAEVVKREMMGKFLQAGMEAMSVLASMCA